MADKGPSIEVAKQAVVMDISKLKASIEGFIYDDLQMKERTRKNSVSIEATRAAIVDKEKALVALEGNTDD